MSSVSAAGMSGIVSLTAGAAPPSRDPAKIRQAASQFEALLLEQILHAAHDPEAGWLGSGGDSSSGCASDFAEQQLASEIAQQGGLGLSKLIASGLDRSS